MEDVKVVGNNMRRALHAKSPALSLGRIDPYWRSQLLVEYSKDHGACMILDDPKGDDRYIVVDEVIYLLEILRGGGESVFLSIRSLFNLQLLSMFVK